MGETEDLLTDLASRTHRSSIISRQELEDFFEERRKSHHEMIETVATLTQSVAQIKLDLDQFRESTKDLLEVFRALQGVATVIVWIGKIVKPLAIVATIITGATLYFQGLKIPKLVP